MTATLTPTNPPTTCWSLSEEDQQYIADSIPKQDTWVLNVVRNSQGFWYFDLPEYDIYNELFVGGTELSLDWHYLDLCLAQGLEIDLESAQLEMVVSSRPIDDCTTTLSLMCFDKEEPNASYYKDMRSDITCWLCPMLYYMFKEVPGTLYLDLYPDLWAD